MGDNDGRAPPDDGIDGRLDLLLRQRIHGSGSFVQHNDLRLSKDGPGEGDQLFFAGGQQIAALPNVGVEALLQLGDHAFCRYEPNRIPDLLFRRIRSAVQQVFPDGAGEQMGRLQHVAQRRMQPQLGALPGIPAVDQQAAFRRLIEPADEAGQRGFARTGLAHDGEVRAEGDLQVKVL